MHLHERHTIASTSQAALHEFRWADGAARWRCAHAVWSAGACRQVHSRVLHFGGVFAFPIRSHFCAGSVRSVLLENSQHEACELPLLQLRGAGRDSREHSRVFPQSARVSDGRDVLKPTARAAAGSSAPKMSRLRRGCAMCSTNPYFLDSPANCYTLSDFDPHHAKGRVQT